MLGKLIVKSRLFGEVIIALQVAVNDYSFLFSCQRKVKRLCTNECSYAKI